jgi:RNA polymerase sigma-70 factor (ECF subfamily)
VLPAAARVGLTLPRLDPGIGQDLVALLPAVRRYARHLTRDPDEADDIAQSVAVKALDRGGGICLEGWLIAAARNEFLDRARARTRFVRCAMDPVPFAGDQLPRLELMEVANAMARLTDRQRRAVIGTAFGDRLVDVARAMGISEQAAQRHLAKGRARLAELTGAACAKRPKIALPVVRRLLDQGKSNAQIARKLNVSQQWIWALSRRPAATA